MEGFWTSFIKIILRKDTGLEYLPRINENIHREIGRAWESY